MQKPPIPTNEKARLEALRNLHILDTANEPAYDNLVELAAWVCGCEIALISLIDSNRQWFKSKTGIASSETSRDVSFCAHAIMNTDLFVIPDARNDSRFSDNPLVTNKPYIRFYAGVPLIDSKGYALGTLCVIDSRPGELNDDQLRMLQHLAGQVALLLEMHRNNQELRRYRSELEHYRQESEAERELVSKLMHRMMRPGSLGSNALQHWMEPTSYSGGDLIVAGFSPHGKYYLLIADSTGHGLPAAINLLPVSQIFHSMVSKSLPVSLIIEEMNHRIHEQSPIERFVAAIIVCFDLNNRLVEVWNGGMPDALYLDGQGNILQRFISAELPLGIDGNNSTPHTSVYQWSTPGQLFVCSDGLSEALSPEERSLGIRAIETILGCTPPEKRFDAVRNAVLEHQGVRSAHDDISMALVDIGKLAKSEQ